MHAHEPAVCSIIHFAPPTCFIPQRNGFKFACLKPRSSPQFILDSLGGQGEKNLVGMIMIYCIFEAQTGSSVWDFQGAGERHGEDGDPSVSVGTAAGAQ